MGPTLQRKVWIVLHMEQGQLRVKLRSQGFRKGVTAAARSEKSMGRRSLCRRNICTATRVTWFCRLPQDALVRDHLLTLQPLFQKFQFS
jgi:hypothetical protein